MLNFNRGSVRSGTSIRQLKQQSNSSASVMTYCTCQSFRSNFCFEAAKKFSSYYYFYIAISGPQVQCSPLRLCSWTYEFYMLLLAKFSLYFHDSLQPQCSAGDFDHTIGAMKSPNFVQIFITFQRRMEPLFILLIANRFNASDISPCLFYQPLVLFFTVLIGLIRKF